MTSTGARQQAAEAETPHASATIRVGVLGTGYWARWCHGTALQAHPGVDLVGFWGRDSIKAEQAAAEVGAEAFSDLGDLLERVDAVSIALPPAIQAVVVPRVADARVHMLLDKPLAMDVASADRAASAVRKAGVATVSFMTLRFQPTVVEWLAKMSELSRLNGPWAGLSMTWAGAIDEPGSPYADSTWRLERGGLWDLGPHALSVIEPLMGEVADIQAMRGTRDETHVLLRHVGGQVSSMNLTLTASPEAKKAAIEVWGPAGRYGLDLPMDGLREAYTRAVDSLICALASGSDGTLDANYGRDLVRILDRAERAAGLSSASFAGLR